MNKAGSTSSVFPIRVLVVDDHPNTATMLARAITQLGPKVDVVAATSGKDALEKVKGGTGLGLPISRKLVNMHGGRLWAESTGVAGEGSTFFVVLPLEARVTEIVEKREK